MTITLGSSEFIQPLMYGCGLCGPVVMMFDCRVEGLGFNPWQNDKYCNVGQGTLHIYIPLHAGI